MTLAAAVLAAAVVAGADTPPAGWPGTGEKVRVTTLMGGDRKSGVVVQADAESLTVSLGSGKPPVRIPLASMKRLDVARGRRSSAKQGAIVGGILGAGLGALAVAGFVHATCETDDCSPGAEGYGAAMGVFGAGGAGIGALIGLAIKTDRWEPVPIGPIRIGLVPVAAGAGVQVSLGFGRP